MPELRTQYPSSESVYDDARSSSKQRAAQTAFRAMMQGLVDSSTGPLFEVGGATREGFASLDGVHLRNGLVISNALAHSDEWKIMSPVTKPVDVIADVRDLQLERRSIGGILMSYLSVISDVGRVDPATGIIPVDIKAAMAAHDALYLLAEKTNAGDMRRWGNKKLHDSALRVAFLSEARRSVEPGGLMIVRGVDENELFLAEALGFEYKFGVSEYAAQLSLSPRGYNAAIDEHVLQLTDLDTPAGRAVEERPF